MTETIRTLDPIDRMLAGFVIFFALLLLLIAKWSPNDGQTFQVFSAGFTGCLGGLLGRMAPKKDSPPKQPEGGTA